MFLYRFESRGNVGGIVEYELTHEAEFTQEMFSEIVNSAIGKFNEGLTEDELSDIGPNNQMYGIHKILIEEYGFKKPIFTQEILLTDNIELKNPFHKEFG